MRFKSSTDVIEYVKSAGIEMIDLKFVDLFGAWHHVSLPGGQCGERMFREGVAFDGGTIPGFKRVESGDMTLLPDPSSAFMDIFWQCKTLSMICNVVEADTLAPFSRDPRLIAAKAEAYLASLGIADRSLWSPEFEFYIFDHLTYKNDINMAFYRIDSQEADWNSGVETGQNLGYKIPQHGGYHAIPPMDSLYDLRAEMVQQIEACNIPVRYHHHEVGGPGQSEIEVLFNTLVPSGDTIMLVKYIIKMVAKRANKTVTFMPKPLYNEAGSGMHFHQMLMKGSEPLFYRDDPQSYAQLSDTALHYIGGLLTHAPALLALTNPSTNSYKRLVPGFEAPVRTFYGLANRSAAVRIPKYAKEPHEKRIEFRPPDATCNPYLALAGQLMAGIDGIRRKIDPRDNGFGPFDVNVFSLPQEERDKIGQLPGNLREALMALTDDSDFLREGGVFPEDFFALYIDQKMTKEHFEVKHRPHPYEISLYFDA